MAKKKKEKKGGKRMKKKELVETLISYIRTKPFEAFSLKQLFQGLNLTTHPLKMLCGPATLDYRKILKMRSGREMM